MLDGRIDTQGTVQDLRSRGLLDAIKHDSTAMATAKEDPEAGASESTETKPDSSKPAAKLVEDEERAQGDVPWHIYKCGLFYCLSVTNLPRQNLHQGRFLLDVGDHSWALSRSSGIHFLNISHPFSHSLLASRTGTKILDQGMFCII
jgi:hypothetical protein